MENICIELTDEQHHRLLARLSGRDIPGLVKKLLLEWLQKEELEAMREAEWKLRGPYLKHRFRGLDISQTAQKLNCRKKDLLRIDDDIRSNSSSWNEAFVYLHNADPVYWALLSAERFYSLWGKRRKS